MTTDTLEEKHEQCQHGEEVLIDNVKDLHPRKKQRLEEIASSSSDAAPQGQKDVKEPTSAAVSAPASELEIVQPLSDDKLGSEDVVMAEQTISDESDVASYRVKAIVPKFSQKKDIERLLKSLELPMPLKMKKVPRQGWCLLTYDNAAHHALALEKLNGAEMKGATIKAENAPANHKDPFRSSEDNANNKKTGEQQPVNENDGRSEEERLNDQVTPLWRKGYEEQLQEKEAIIKQIMVKFCRQLRDQAYSTERMQNYTKKMADKARRRENTEGNTAETESGNKEDGEKKTRSAFLHSLRPSEPPCPVLPLIPSPTASHYRNKVEFTFGMSPSGEKTVGFSLGLYKDGEIRVCSPQQCVHASLESLAIAKALQEFITKDSFGSSINVYDRIDKVGFWRLALVRNNENGHVLCVVQGNDADVTAEQLSEIKSKLSEFFKSKVASGDIKCDGLLFQPFSGVHHGFSSSVQCELLFGIETIKSHLMDLSFQISPTSFFQVNHGATASLYSGIMEWSGLTEAPAAPCNEKIILDLCCGTGTIGQILAKSPAKPSLVIGIEMVESAVKDAERNARENGLDNVRYICSKVEDGMKKILGIVREMNSLKNNDAGAPSTEEKPWNEMTKEEQAASRAALMADKDVIAILDPPRSGVHPTVIRSLRETLWVKKIIFVSCDAENAMSNFVDLCRPTTNKYRGAPFVPVRAQGWDLFPSTRHFEVMIEFKRE